MGISISYRGSLSNPASYDDAIKEIRAFCQRAGWQCDDYAEHHSGVLLVTQPEADGDPGTKVEDTEPWPEQPEGQHFSLRARVSKLHPPHLIEETLRGVLVQPPDTETLHMVFDHTGRLVHYLEIPLQMVINAIPDTLHYAAFPNFVGTTSAPGSHAAICILLQVLKKKFMRRLRVNDGTGFYKTGDLQKLLKSHQQMDALVGLLRRSKDVGALLQKLGVDVPKGGKIVQLDPTIEVKSPATKKKKTSIN